MGDKKNIYKGLVVIIIAIVFFIVSGIFLGEYNQNITQNVTIFEILGEVRPLALEYNKTNNISVNQPTIKGKIVLDESMIGFNQTPSHYLTSSNIHTNGGFYDTRSIADIAPHTLLENSTPIDRNITLDPNTNLTFFIQVRKTGEFVGYWQCELGGMTVSGFRDTTYIVVIHWPEKEVVGMYRIHGDIPPPRVRLHGGVKIAGDDNVGEWIASLPMKP